VMAFFFWSAILPNGVFELDKDAIPEHGFPGNAAGHSLQRNATTSISTSASFGKRAACTVERAGGAAVK
jgi:hypothetical protein